jgi:oligoendopeptidase F
MIVSRDEVLTQDKWNVEAFYPNFDSWQKEFKAICPQETNPHWPFLQEYKGHLGDKPETLRDCLESILSLARKLSSLHTYAHLRHDEDITHDGHKSAYNSITAVFYDFQQETSWFEPELLALPEATLNVWLKSPVLADYRFYIEKIVRIKKHMLTPEMEELMALSSKALQTSHKTFSALNDADLKFGTVIDSEGKERELTHGTMGIYIRDRDRLLRERAFKQMHDKYLDFENTLCELVNGQIQSHVYNAKARHYSGCLEAALFPKNIDTSVYHSLIKAVHSQMPSLHKYIGLRKKILGLDTLHLYDMYVPLTPNIDIKMPYEEAQSLVIESTAPLGPEYQELLRQGLEAQRWVDRYENKNKRSGAYSSGCYDSMPFILMNYKQLLRDVFTLAHEAGHSMHSLLSHKYQPYHYSDYPIFLAEVASTFNEELLIRLLLEKAKSKEEKIFLINQKIEDIRATLFRQTLFAEFELKVHELAEKNVPLTPKLLKEIYRHLNEQYFGSEAFIDSEIDIEWARIPHFYYNFYVFQYATGISAALALADKVLREGDQARDAYLSFLKGGSSLYPIDLLRVAGVDMRSPEPVEAAIRKFSGLVDQLENLIFST